jgi:NADH-quinone oxidoreductase subunit K
MVPLSHILALSVILFALGAAGFVLRRNIITVFMCIELMLNAVNLAFIGFSRQLGSLDGQIFVFFVIVVAASEAAVGLAIIIALYRNRDSLNIDDLDSMKL